MPALLVLGLAAIFFAGLERWRRTEPDGVGLEAVVLVATGEIALLGIASTLLAAFDVFRPLTLLSTMLLLALVLWPWSIRSAPWAFRRPSWVAGVFTLLLLVSGLALRLPFADYELAGRDQGTYTLRAHQALRTGGLLEHDDALARAGRDAGVRSGPADILGLYPRRHEDWRDGVYEAAYRPGWYLVDRDHGLVAPQFLHLHPMTMAWAGMVTTARYAWSILVIQAALTLLALWSIARRLWPREPWPILAAGLLVVHPLAIWVHRTALSEVPAGLFFATATLAILRARSSPASLDHAALFLGALAWTRGNGWLAAPILLAATWLTPHDVPNRRRPALVYATLVVAAVLVHAATSFPYLYDEFQRQFGLGRPSPGRLVVLTFVAAAAWLAIDELGFHRQPNTGARKLSKWAPFILGGLLIGGLGLHLWLRGGEVTRPYSRLDPAVVIFGATTCALATVGLVSTLRRWTPGRRAADAWLVGLATVVTATVWLYAPRNLPNLSLYYYARYLTPELLPVVCLLATQGVRAITLRLAGSRPAFGTRRLLLARGFGWSAGVGLLVVTAAPLVLHPVTRLREFEGAGRVVELLGRLVPENAVVIAGGEGWHHGHTFNQVGGALAMRFGPSVLPYRTKEAAYATAYELLVLEPEATGRPPPPVFLLLNEATHNLRLDPAGAPIAAIDDLLPPPFAIRRAWLFEQITDRLTPVWDRLPDRVTRDGLRMALFELEVDPDHPGERRIWIDDPALSIEGPHQPEQGRLCLSPDRDVVLTLPADGYGPRSVVLVAAPGTASRNHEWLIEIDGEERSTRVPRATARARDTLGPWVLERPPIRLHLRGAEKAVRDAPCPHGGLVEIRILEPDRSALIDAESTRALTFAPDRDLGHPVEPTRWVPGGGLSRYRTGIAPDPEIEGLSLVVTPDRPIRFAPVYVPELGRTPLRLVVTLTASHVSPDTRLVLRAQDRPIATIDPPDDRDGSWQSDAIEWTPPRSVTRLSLELEGTNDPEARVLVRDLGLFSEPDQDSVVQSTLADPAP